MGQRHNAMVVGRLWRGVIVGKNQQNRVAHAIMAFSPIFSASHKKYSLGGTVNVCYLRRLCLKSDGDKHADKIAPLQYPSGTVLCVTLSAFKFTKSAHFLNATRIYSSFFVCAEKPLSLLHFQGR